ncbi:MAG: helix-turn-helix domain-containing protein [Hyphomicrobiaceae bacterium]|nr:MAG: helix-turn-helix domain-containing protein [Hyphomicrobiaceae bacterium]
MATQTITLIKAKEVQELLAVSRDKLRQLIRDGVVPRPIQLGPKTRRWDRAEVLACVRARSAA